mmetsp:Transcript_8312/g.30690  ORF Transcript_8312/g.30690 Transcript_8312/m.30690 type:complete len:230 (-) Transcript_8312:610-1299(-)
MNDWLSLEVKNSWRASHDRLADAALTFGSTFLEVSGNGSRLCRESRVLNVGGGSKSTFLLDKTFFRSACVECGFLLVLFEQRALLLLADTKRSLSHSLSGFSLNESCCPHWHCLEAFLHQRRLPLPLVRSHIFPFESFVSRAQCTFLSWSHHIWSTRRAQNTTKRLVHLVFVGLFLMVESSLFLHGGEHTTPFFLRSHSSFLHLAIFFLFMSFGGEQALDLCSKTSLFW